MKYFFVKSNIRDIFELVDADVTKVKDSNLTQLDLEQVMARVEDERDVVAAKVAGAEAVADLAEFDESQTNADGDEADPDVIKVEQEMKQLMDEVSLKMKKFCFLLQRCSFVSVETDRTLRRKIFGNFIRTRSVK